MLTIANMAANYFIPRGAPDPAGVRTRLDRLIEERLPIVANGWLQPSTADEEAVYRIRHLQFDLWIDGLGMDESEIVQRTAQLMVRSITHALLYAPPSEVIRFDDHAHFVASFLVDLLSGQAQSRWVYAEFAALFDLPVGQVAAQMLGARPGLLLPVVQRLARQQRLHPLIAQMHLSDIHLLMRHGLGFDSPPLQPVMDDELTSILRIISNDVGLERKADKTTQARNTLRIYLAVLLTRPDLYADSRLLAVAHHLALLQSLWSARPALSLFQALANQEIDSVASIAPLLHSLDSELGQAGEWLRHVMREKRGRHYLAQLVTVAIPETSSPSLASKGGNTKPERISSAFAGLALLLPALRTLDLYRQIGRAGIYQLLLMAVGRTMQPLAWGDEGVAWLAGVAADEMETARSKPILWSDIQLSDVIGRESTINHAMTLIIQRAIRIFAQGLRGFSDSSTDYLAKQFFHTTGVLTRTPEMLEVHLNRAPLGVILHMAGRTGDQGMIPWLDGRQLLITLPET